MATFTIDSENKITSYAPGEAVPDGNAERFTNEGELAELAAQWPSSRLVEVWNGIPGSMPVRKFTDRKTAVARIWKVAQSLASRANAPHVAPKAARPGKRASRKTKAHTGRDPGGTHGGYRLAGAQRSRVHLGHARQETQNENRLVQNRER